MIDHEGTLKNLIHLYEQLGGFLVVNNQEMSLLCSSRGMFKVSPCPFSEFAAMDWSTKTLYFSGKADEWPDLESRWVTWSRALKTQKTRLSLTSSVGRSQKLGLVGLQGDSLIDSLASGVGIEI